MLKFLSQIEIIIKDVRSLKDDLQIIKLPSLSVARLVKTEYVIMLWRMITAVRVIMLWHNLWTLNVSFSCTGCPTKEKFVLK